MEMSPKSNNFAPNLEKCIMKRPHIVNMISTITRQEMPNAEVFLFGSEARGEARIDSDIDLLILLNQNHVSWQDKERIVAPLYNIELQTSTIINPIIYSQADWKNRPLDYFKLNVMNEGVRL